MQLQNLFDKIDKIVFVLIHNDSDSKMLDKGMLFLRDPYSWIPLYIFILFYVIKKDKSKTLPFILLSVICFSVTDSFTSQVLKPFFGRLRPCYEPQLQGFVRNLIDCGGMYSFPSSHAANHFGLAAFWYWAAWLITGKKWNWLWVWASLICYAQVYAGKHYPSDVLAGAFLGWMIGTICAKIFHRWAYPGKQLSGKALPDEMELNAALLL